MPSPPEPHRRLIRPAEGGVAWQTTSTSDTCCGGPASAPARRNCRRSTGKSTFEALAYVMDVDDQPDDVDIKIGQPDYINVTARGPFSPNTNIEDARQRWLFRMVHSRRPLQEKMALFWHNHFATAYSKIAGTFGAIQGTKMMALKAGELPGPQGQIETFREKGLGSFRDLLVAMARGSGDARLAGRAHEHAAAAAGELRPRDHGALHARRRPLHRGRRLRRGARVHRMESAPGRGTRSTTARLLRVRLHPGQPRSDGQDVHVPDLSGRLEDDSGARRRAAACRTASTSSPPSRRIRPRPSAWRASCGTSSSAKRFRRTRIILRGATGIYFANGTRIKPLVHYMLQSRWFQNPGQLARRYAWPVEFAVRAVKEVGFLGFSVDNMRAPLIAMGQTLFEPPDVNGWELGQGWFSTGAMLARMNFAVDDCRQPALQSGDRRGRRQGLARHVRRTTSSNGCRRRRSSRRRSTR